MPSSYEPLVYECSKTRNTIQCSVKLTSHEHHRNYHRQKLRKKNGCSVHTRGRGSNTIIFVWKMRFIITFSFYSVRCVIIACMYHVVALFFLDFDYCCWKWQTLGLDIAWDMMWMSDVETSTISLRLHCPSLFASILIWCTFRDRIHVQYIFWIKLFIVQWSWVETFQLNSAITKYETI